MKALEKMKYIGDEFGLKSGIKAASAQQEGYNLHVQMLPAVEAVSHTSKAKFFATPGTVKVPSSRRGGELYKRDAASFNIEQLSQPPIMGDSVNHD